MSIAILEYIVSPVLIAVVGYLIGRLKDKDEQSKARDKAEVVLLRKMLKEYYDTYKDSPEIDEFDYQNFIEGYSAYHSLGGNGMVTKMYNDLSSKKIKY